MNCFLTKKSPQIASPSVWMAGVGVVLHLLNNGCFSTSQARNCIFVNCTVRLLCKNDIVQAKWTMNQLHLWLWPIKGAVAEGRRPLLLFILVIDSGFSVRFAHFACTMSFSHSRRSVQLTHAIARLTCAKKHVEHQNPWAPTRIQSNTAQFFGSHPPGPDNS